MLRYYICYKLFHLKNLFLEQKKEFFKIKTIQVYRVRGELSEN